MKQTLFDRIGGEDAIAAAVEIFYGKVLEDPLLASYFDRMEIKQQVNKMISFMSWAFGGPMEYRGLDLTLAHKDLVLQQGLGDQHFDAIAHHLQSTLNELGVSDELAAEVMSLIGGTRNQVLGRG